MAKQQKFGLTTKILLGLFIGLLFGVVLNLIGADDFIQIYLIDGLLNMGGKIFVAALRLLVVPIVFVSLVAGTASLGSLRELGVLGGKTLGLYLFTTCVAISLALAVAVLISPGVGLDLETEASFVAKEAPPLTDVIVNLFPSNPIKALAEGEMLQIIVFSILFGLALMATGAAGKRVLSVFKDLNEVIMKLVMMLMEVAPYGVFCLVAKVFAEQGLSAILPLGKYFGTVLLVLLLHATVTYPALLKFLTRLSPVRFFKNFKNPIIFGFSTASSNATLPITMETVEYQCGVKSAVTSFTLPLGATINMDGTAIMQGVATVFIAQVYGIDLSISGYLMVILTATLASIGTAGVPGVGLIMLAMVLRQVGLPVEGIGLIIGIDRLLDMVRTCVNIVGDGVVTCIVAKSEKMIDEDVFNADTKHEPKLKLP
jgi:Na+/H+-dicarboxylate symporter